MTEMKVTRNPERVDAMTAEQVSAVLGPAMPELHQMWVNLGSPPDHVILFNMGSGRAGCIPKETAASDEFRQEIGDTIVEQIKAGPRPGFIHVLADVGHGYILAQASVSDEADVPNDGRHVMVDYKPPPEIYDGPQTMVTRDPTMTDANAKKLHDRLQPMLDFLMHEWRGLGSPIDVVIVVREEEGAMAIIPDGELGAMIAAISDEATTRFCQTRPQEPGYVRVLLLGAGGFVGGVVVKDVTAGGPLHIPEGHVPVESSKN